MIKGTRIPTPPDVVRMLAGHLRMTMQDCGIPVRVTRFRDAPTRYPYASFAHPDFADRSAQRAVEGRIGMWEILA